MTSRKYGTRDVRHGPGSLAADEESWRFSSAHSETVCDDGGRIAERHAARMSDASERRRKPVGECAASATSPDYLDPGLFGRRVAGSDWVQAMRRSPHSEFVGLDLKNCWRRQPDVPAIL